MCENSPDKRRVYGYTVGSTAEKGQKYMSEQSLQAMNNQKREELWAMRIKQCRESGLKVKEWCAEQGLCLPHIFANTPKGAGASAVTFSIIQTAIANNLDPYRYLVYIFKEAPKLAAADSDWVSAFLPQNVPLSCHADS